MAELLGGRPSYNDNGKERGEGRGGEGRDFDSEACGEERRWANGEWWTGREEEGKWSVRGEKVLELGAGA